MKAETTTDAARVAFAARDMGDEEKKKERARQAGRKIGTEARSEPD